MSNRYLKTFGVLLGSKDLGENDILYSFYTQDFGYFSSIAKGEGKSAKFSPEAFNTYEIFFYSKSSSDFLNRNNILIRDIKIVKNRTRLFIKKTEIYFLLSNISFYLKTFDKVDVLKTYEVYIDFLDSLEEFVISNNNDDLNIKSKTEVYIIEKLFEQCGFKTELKECPICSKKFDDDEELGYSEEIHSPSCITCSFDLDKSLLPGMRRYLQYTSDLELGKILELNVSDQTISRLLLWERKRVFKLNPSLYKNLI